jgi:hypothetical protein
VGGPAIVLGRRAGEGGGAAIANAWPGLVRRPGGRDLAASEIERSVWPDAEQLGRYAEGAEVVTDDNQMLQWSDIRAGLRGERGVRLGVTNMVELMRISGGEPFQAER